MLDREVKDRANRLTTLVTTCLAKEELFLVKLIYKKKPSIAISPAPVVLNVCIEDEGLQRLPIADVLGQQKMLEAKYWEGMEVMKRKNANAC
jgi:hypothetical protein